jgi:hypothetical protein
MINNLLKLLLLFFVVLAPANASVYYVSPTGNDTCTGLTLAEPWGSIDHQSDHMHPGDTVNILPGTYTISNQIELTSAGTGSAPIVYRGFEGRPLITGHSIDVPLIYIKESHIVIENLELSNGHDDGIFIEKDNCIIANCYIHDIDKYAIRVEGSDNLVMRNVVAHAGLAGIRNSHEGQFNHYYGNTIHDATSGIIIQVNENTARIINNIITSCNLGISGVAGNVCAYNILWNNLAGEYFGGVVDSAGGMMVDPLYIDTAAGDFHLGFGSLAIDAGIDLGYAYSGLAPDIGALETGKLTRLDIVPVYDTLCADSLYQFFAIAYDSAGNPAPTGHLSWSHTFTTGTIDSTGLFSPVGTGLGQIIVTSDIDEVSGQTDAMYIRPGILTTIAVTTDTLTIAAGDSYNFSARGFDKNANEVTEIGRLTWIVSGNMGEIDSTGLFGARHVGSGTVAVQSDLGFVATSGEITVVPGAPAFLSVLPATNVVQTLQSYQYTVLCFDTDSNLIADYSDLANWSTTDLVGNITSFGLYTAGLVGNYWIKADYDSMRDSGTVSIVLFGGLDHIKIEYFNGTPVSTVTLSTDIDTTRFYARGYTASDELIGDVSIDWTIVGPDSIAALAPTIGTVTELSLLKPGDIRIAAEHISGFVDTTEIISVIAGQPASLAVLPDTATLSVGGTVLFAIVARDADDNVVNPQLALNWNMTDSIGTIDSTGLFTATTVGETRIVAIVDGLADSSDQITVVAGSLASIRIEPDSVAVSIGDTIQFSAIGLDSVGNITGAGQITWKALGRVGKIDTNGRYIAELPGIGAVAAANLIAEIYDTTQNLRVEELYFTTIPLGNAKIRPDGDEATIAGFRLDNYFSQTKTVTSISIRDLSSGAGTSEELAANMIAARVYLDSDADSIRTPVDSLLGEIPYETDRMTFAIPAVDIMPDSGLTFLITAKSARYARDGDSVDVALIPGLDIETADFTIPAGPALSNSIGITAIDGMVAGQIAMIPVGNATIGWADSLFLCLSVDLPRNGYMPDTLNGLDLINSGSATESDFDSLLLFADDGDGIWGGADDEMPLGQLIFNGETWSRGGLALEMINESTRLYVAAKIARFPKDRTTIKFELPLQGVRVASNNDGPLDQVVISPDSITIEGRQAIIAAVVSIPTRLCVPGQNSGPLLIINLTNGYSEDITLEEWTFAFIGTDPAGATAEQIESQIDSIYLYLKSDNDVAAISSGDSLLDVSNLADGKVTFNTSALELSGGGGNLTFAVTAELNLHASKNGNTIAFALSDSSSLICDQPVHISGAFPFNNTAQFSINAFPGAAVTVYPLQTANLYAGQNNQPVLDLEIPRNGYAADMLTEINVLNSGSLADNGALENVWLWQDLTANGYTPDDLFIGAFKPAGGQWRLDGINAALTQPSNRFIVTVSVAGEQSFGGTLRFDIPMLGIKYASGTIGPDDAAVENPTASLLFPSNRITAISIPTATTIVSPGSSNHLVMTFALYNGYLDQTKTLNQVTLTNSSHSVGSAAFSDHELGQVSLYWDIDKNRIFDNDMLMGAGLFTEGVLKIEGLSAVLAPESLAYFFIVADLPLDLIDGDSLSVSVEQPSDFAFSEYVNLNGDLPLSSGGYIVTNGSIWRQYTMYGPNGRSLAPGDTDIVLMAFTPAFNGDQDDQLNQIIIQNLGDADTVSVTDLKLWHDVDGNHALNLIDSVLGLFIYNGGLWSAQNLALPISQTPPALLISGSVGVGALSGATFRGAIPTLGCGYYSGNDGPTDSTLVAPGIFTVSTSDLRVSIEPLRSSYSVGQVIDVAMSIANKSIGQLDSVYAEIIDIINPQLVRLDSSIAGPVDLLEAEVFTCHYYYTAIGAGQMSWSLRSLSRSSGDSSAVVQTPVVSIQYGISPISLHILNSSPTAVTKGQANIFPLTLSCVHPDTGNGAAALSLQSLRVRVLDGQGTAVSAASVFNRMIVATGMEILSVVQTVPAQSDVLFTFDSPLIILPGMTQNLMLMVDISSNASIANFMISVDSAIWVPFVNDNNDQIVSHSLLTIYPIRTSPTRIDSPSQQVGVSAISCAQATANYLQQGVDILKLYFRHTGQSGSSSVQITKLSITITDSIGAPLAAGDLFDRITLRRQNYIIGDLISLPHDSLPQEISLSTPLNLNPQEMDSVYISVSIKSAPGAPGFCVTIADSNCFVVRDLNTSSALLVISDTVLASGTVFPIISSWTTFKFPAEAPFICLDDISPSSVTGGVDSIPLISFTMTYPISEQHSSLRLVSANMKIISAEGQLLDPELLFDKIGICVEDGPMQYAPSLSFSAGMLSIPFGNAGQLLYSGDSVNIRLYADLRPDAPYSDFAAAIVGIDDIMTIDVSDAQHFPGVSTTPGCPQIYPFITAPISIFMPAGRPVVLHSSQAVRIAPAGSRRVTLFDGSLVYNSTSPVGQIEIRGLTAQLKRRVQDDLIHNDGTSVEAVHLEINGNKIGSDTTLFSDSIIIIAAVPAVIERGDSVSIRLTCDLADSAPIGNLVMIFGDSSFLQIVDGNLSTAIFPVLSEHLYPYKAGEISIAVASLKSSFTNYPNPFNPERLEATTIGYVLTEDATVDIEIFMITGDLVCQVANHSRRLAGTHQSNIWEGKNWKGQLVQPGVYFCQITATYSSGRVESFKRKIAVIR